VFFRLWVEGKCLTAHRNFPQRLVVIKNEQNLRELLAGDPDNTVTELKVGKSNTMLNGQAFFCLL